MEDIYSVIKVEMPLFADNYTPSISIAHCVIISACSSGKSEDVSKSRASGACRSGDISRLLS